MAGVLVLLSIALITIYFRESSGGGLHQVQSAGATVLRPFEVAADRVSRPFRDAYGYFAGLVHAKSENGRLRRDLDKWRQEATQNAYAASEKTDLLKKLHFVNSRSFPGGYGFVGADIISQPPAAFAQQVVIAAGSASGIRKFDPVVTGEGLVGTVVRVAHNQSLVALLIDDTTSVVALDVKTRAQGIVKAAGRPELDLPARDRDRTGYGGRPERRGSLQAREAAALRGLQDPELRARADPEEPMIADIAKGAAVLFVAAIVQVTLLSQIDVFYGAPDLVLVTLVAVALLRGTIFGAAAGFGAGLVVDTATLQTLGVSSLLLTIAGYWIGRYGETTGRDRSHAPFVSVAVVTLLYSLGALILHYMLGDPASASRVLLDAFPFELIFNLILTLPVYALCRRLFRPPPTGLEEVRLLG